MSPRSSSPAVRRLDVLFRCGAAATTVCTRAGADARNARSDGITALMAAASGGHAPVAIALLAAGADVDAVDRGRPVRKPQLHHSRTENVTIILANISVFEHGRGEGSRQN